MGRRRRTAFDRFKLAGNLSADSSPVDDDYYVVHDDGTDEGPVDTESDELVTYDPAEA